MSDIHIALTFFAFLLHVLLYYATKKTFVFDMAENLHGVNAFHEMSIWKSYMSDYLPHFRLAKHNTPLLLLVP